MCQIDLNAKARVMQSAGGVAGCSLLKSFLTRCQAGLGVAISTAILRLRRQDTGGNCCRFGPWLAEDLIHRTRQARGGLVTVWAGATRLAEDLIHRTRQARGGLVRWWAGATLAEDLIHRTSSRVSIVRRGNDVRNGNAL